MLAQRVSQQVHARLDLLPGFVRHALETADEHHRARFAGITDGVRDVRAEPIEAMSEHSMILRQLLSDFREAVRSQVAGSKHDDQREPLTQIDCERNLAEKVCSEGRHDSLPRFLEDQPRSNGWGSNHTLPFV